MVLAAQAMYHQNELAALRWGRKLCVMGCGRWAVYDQDGKTLAWLCPLCWCVAEAEAIDHWWEWRKMSLQSHPSPNILRSLQSLRAPRAPLLQILKNPDVSDRILSFLESLRAPRAPLLQILTNPDVSDLILSFLEERPGRYDLCCMCGDVSDTPCHNEWFEDGWVCPDHWQVRVRPPHHW